LLLSRKFVLVLRNLEYSKIRSKAKGIKIVQLPHASPDLPPLMMHGDLPVNGLSIKAFHLKIYNYEFNNNLI
jgi:hypothetical protein